jgi:hypothetical protein
MNRAYGEPVNVQARDDGRPARFVWRGRLYTVRAILEHWVVNREWWQDRGPPKPTGPAGPTGATGPRPGQQEPGQQEPGQQEPGQQEPGQQEPGQQEPGQQEPGQQELEFWRVEASSGQGMAAGVYELRREAAADAWTLRVGG